MAWGDCILKCLFTLNTQGCAPYLLTTGAAMLEPNSVQTKGDIHVATHHSQSPSCSAKKAGRKAPLSEGRARRAVPVCHSGRSHDTQCGEAA